MKIKKTYPIKDPRLGDVQVVELESDDGRPADVYINDGTFYARADKRGPVYATTEPLGLVAWFLSVFGRR